MQIDFEFIIAEISKTDLGSIKKSWKIDLLSTLQSCSYLPEKTHEKESKNATNQNLRCDVINIEYISLRVTFFLKYFSFAIIFYGNLEIGEIFQIKLRFWR